jgi:hypothetical protein
MKNLTSRSTMAGLATALIALSASTSAQETGGLQLTLGVKSTLRADDNLNLDTNSAGTSSFMTHRLSFGLLSETRTQKLQASLSGVLRYGNIAGGSTATGFDDPSGRLSYAREAGNGRFGLDAGYQTGKLQFQRLSEDPDELDLITDTGRLDRSDIGVSFETGLSDPFSLALSGRYDRRDYSNTTDPDLYNSDTKRVSATAGLRLSPTLNGRVEASRSDYSAQNASATDRQSTSLGLGLSGYVNSSLSFDVSLGNDRIDTRETILGVRVKTVDTGNSGALSLIQTLPDGTASVSLRSDFSTLGNRYTLSVGRDLELPDGALSASIGMTKSDTGTTFAVGSLQYRRDQPSGQMTVRLDRSLQTSAEDEEQGTTRVGLGYLYQINPVSSFNLSLDYAQIKGYGTGAATDRGRGNFQAVYNRNLTPDWVLSGGYEMRYSIKEGTGSARSNAVFISLDRVFSLSP